MHIGELPLQQGKVADAALRVQRRGIPVTPGAIVRELGVEDTPLERNRISTTMSVLRRKGFWPPAHEASEVEVEVINPVPATASRRDPEVVAMEAIAEVLERLEPRARRRVLTWVTDRQAETLALAGEGTR